MHHFESPEDVSPILREQNNFDKTFVYHQNWSWNLASDLEI